MDPTYQPVARGRARGRTRGGALVPPAPGTSATAGGDLKRIGVPSSLKQQVHQQQLPKKEVQQREDSDVHVAKLQVGIQKINLGIAGSGPKVKGDGAPVIRVKHSSKSDADVQCNIVTKPRELTTKRGRTGKIIDLTSNYFRLESVTSFQLYQYRVDFAPEEDLNSMKQKLVRAHRETIGAYIFDGTLLFTAHKLLKDPLTLVSRREADDTNVVVTIRLVSSVSAGEYHYCHFFNILMRRCLEALNLQLVGRNYFDAKANVPVPNYHLELWPGYVTSIRQHEDDILLCTEITHKVMRRDNALDILESIAEKDPAHFQHLYQKCIVGTTVLTDYNNKTYRVDDVDFTVTPMSAFSRDGKEVTYKAYFKSRYGLEIKNPDQPMLVSLPKLRERRRGFSTPVYLVPELCRMTGITDEMRANFHLMRNLAEHTRLSPKDRIAALNKFQKRLSDTEKVASELKQWNFALSKSLVSLKGRVLPNEFIKVGNDVSFHSGTQNNWGREISGQALLCTPVLREWGIVVPCGFSRPAHSFIATLTEVATRMHFCIKPPCVQEIFDEQTTSYIDGIDSITRKKNPELLMLMLPTRRTDRYNVMKKRGCVDLGIPTQVVLTKNLQGKNLKSIAIKIAIQMCCKIGGAPWSVVIPLSGLMVVGFDVYHEANMRGVTIGALVATMNKDASQYFSAVSYLRTGEEMSSDLTTNIVKALRQYNAYNNCLPQRILLYRDGVGEGQVAYVFQQEVELLRKKLKEIYGEHECKLAYIIVTKRLNTRLFYGLENPPPGTVVDGVITLPQRYDFYLVSQSVHQGTVSPTSYNVISDNLGLEPDQLQRLTYKLTHLYYNWNGTVRVPAPVQYAHKLAFLVGQNLHKIPSPKLEDRLYFL
ncbi:piwi-like protein Siwi [Anabrus simplex]|uniref:piwi-like protein Siwi n=1 Tax=Anabrus simplex TaxID=316456 RepID=UPI0035A359FF